MPRTLSVGDPFDDLASVLALREPDTRIRLAGAARARVRASRAVIERAIASGATVYGVNTGFGKLANVSIPREQTERLQRNLILSHATGVGELLPVPTARLAFGLRIHNLARGYSGVRPELLDAAIALYNAGLTPAIPSQGSVGASGDLAPLAHMALPLLGEGEVLDDAGRRLSGRRALEVAGIAPVRLTAKEGLALINGTQVMTAIGLMAFAHAELLSKAADIACATTIEALRASARPFRKGVHEVRPHRGQERTAANVRRLLVGSEILRSHAHCGKVQDAYSMRCAPQVHGAAKDALAFAREVLRVEADAVTDNPLVFPDGEVVSAGNFHGQPVSQAMDFLAIGVATLANISERRIENLVNPDISGLPPFLAHEPGLESGFMIPQVVAAALASENKSLAHPASVDTIPTSANREDHVSMGVTAARHAAMVVDNTSRVLAIELLTACQGLDVGEPLRPGKGVAAAHAVVRRRVAPLRGDRILAPDIAAIDAMLRDGTLVGAVERAVGKLHA
ncbi:MAG TPA: histidine ammonia-lyase [Planctomycetota bacterium]|nr:histidine ammonia-lyase [Planctomycetota bacterium]